MVRAILQQEKTKRFGGERDTASTVTSQERDERLYTEELPMNLHEDFIITEIRRRPLLVESAY